jgi:hypothetical protein
MTHPSTRQDGHATTDKTQIFLHKLTYGHESHSGTRSQDWLTDWLIDWLSAATWLPACPLTSPRRWRQHSTPKHWNPTTPLTWWPLLEWARLVCLTTLMATCRIHYSDSHIWILQMNWKTRAETELQQTNHLIYTASRTAWWALVKENYRKKRYVYML